MLLWWNELTLFGKVPPYGDIDSGNALLADDTKPLPERRLIIGGVNHLGNFTRNASAINN